MHKLFVDTRDIASGHSSNFHIGLVDNIVVKEQTYAVLDKILIEIVGILSPKPTIYSIMSSMNLAFPISAAASSSRGITPTPTWL